MKSDLYLTAAAAFVAQVSFSDLGQLFESCFLEGFFTCVDQWGLFQFSDL